MISLNAENEQEFQNIYELFHEKIRRYLARMVNETEAEDLSQEVFVKVSRGLKDFKRQSSLSTWIYTIATNTAMDSLRTLSLRKEALVVQRGDDGVEAEDTYLLTEDYKPSLEATLIKKEMNDCIRGIVDGLPENYRTVLVLSDLEGFSDAEIADIAGISLETEKIRLHRARTRLRKALEALCNFYRDESNELACERTFTPLKFRNN